MAAEFLNQGNSTVTGAPSPVTAPLAPAAPSRTRCQAPTAFFLAIVLLDLLASAAPLTTQGQRPPPLRSSRGGNYSGTIADAGYNISDDNSYGFNATGSLNNTNPELKRRHFVAGLPSVGGALSDSHGFPLKLATKLTGCGISIPSRRSNWFAAQPDMAG
jgi:hypothetical protein